MMKFCRDCKWSVPGKSVTEWECTCPKARDHGKVTYDTVTGEEQRQKAWCYIERGYGWSVDHEGACNSAGYHWEAK